MARELAGLVRGAARAGLRSLGDHGGFVAARLGPVGRAAGFYVNAWERWLTPVRERTGGPVPFPSPALALGALADESLLSAARLVRRPLAPEQYGRIRAEVAEAIELFGRQGWLDDPSAYFPPPPPAEPRIRRTRLLLGLGFERFEFDSDYDPHPGEPGRARWLAHGPNRTAHAWVLRHRTPRPWLVGFHGAGMGYPRADLFAFQAAWLHHVLGLNLAFPTMPLHGPRRSGKLPSVGFPNDDLLDTVHGVAQAVWDTRRLVGWIRLHDHDEVGLFGLSLGGYTAAVVAGTERDLSCVIAGVPAADFAELFERHAPPAFRRLPEFAELTDGARVVHRVVSPLALPPQVALDRRFIFAGLADRLVHPNRQVRALWEHWQEPSIHWFEGSHIGFLWSGAVRDFVHRALAVSGMVHSDAA
ncbi:MAG TPA: alpha/beta hydrolase [Acidimicrobiales bacterium]|nr:alpha/beta hydrolase [Acidimicrobiales bacterium]